MPTQTPKITTLTDHVTCGLMCVLMICKIEYTIAIHDTEFPL